MKRIALISDIHANSEALAGVLDDIDRVGVDALWCLGDVVGYGHDPVWCLGQIEAHADVILAGNHDLAVAGTLSTCMFNDWARAGVEHSRSQLSAAMPGSLERLGSRPSQVRISTGSRASILIAHGCPEPFDPVNDYIEIDVSPESLASHLDQSDDVVLAAVGHTHDPFVWTQYPMGHRLVRTNAQFTTDPAIRTSLANADFTVLNVGSVGQPRDGDWRACWTLLELDDNGHPEHVTWMRVAYDVDHAVKRMCESGLPRAIGERLLAGR